MTPHKQPTVERVYGVTHKGTDAQAEAFMENGRVWIVDGEGGWIRCHPGIERYFTANETVTP